MKRFKVLLVSVAMLFLMAACNNNSNSPEGVATAFLEALGTGDYDKAYSCTTGSEEERQAVVANYEQMKLCVTDYKINGFSIEPEGNRATIDVTTTMTSIFNGQAATSDERYNAVMVDGVWKLDF